jgi:predicted porin
VKRILLSSVAVFAFAAVGHADELSDIQAQAKQLREQNQAMTKRLADLEKRQQKLEKQPQAQAAVPHINPGDAMAADLPYKAAIKAPAPVNDDLCWHGVCLYGNFDMGVLYSQHSNPSSDFIGQNAPVEKQSSGSYFGVGSNQFSSSFIGLRGKQEVADGLYAVFNLQTLFYPNSGMSQNGVGSIVQNNGLGAAPFLQNANAYGDSSKGGQMFNNAAYFGISSPTYGTFTMGRQSALTSDMIVNYDPLSGAGALSMITNEGLSGGGGVTEDRIWDNSYEYRINVGPVRLAGEIQAKNGGNSAIGNGFEGDIGFDYMGLSMDFLGGKTFDALSSGPLSSAQVGLITASAAPAVTCSLGCVSGIISDNTVFQMAAKYTIGPWKLFGGYEWIQFANPNNPLTPGAFGEGGYNIGAVNNNAYVTDRVEQVFWAGVRYAITRDLDITGAYYGYRQAGYLTTGAAGGSLVNVVGGANGGITGGACNTAVSAGCSGTMDAASLALDWRFARHFDFYAGVMYSQKTGGLANGYNLTATNMNVAATYNTFNTVSNVDTVAGLRYSF